MASLSTVGTNWGLEYTIVGMHTTKSLVHAGCPAQHAPLPPTRTHCIKVLALLAEYPKKHYREVSAVFPGLDPEGHQAAQACSRYTLCRNTS
jgi:hypothetical protein